MNAPCCNIASSLQQAARRSPDRLAVAEPDGRGGWRQLTFAELDRRAACYAAGLHRIGIRKGTRTVLMVKPGLEFFALVFALFRVGATLVIIDPGISKRALAQCLQEVEAEAFAGIPLAHVARLVFGKALASVRINVTVGHRWLWGGHRLRDLLDEPGRDIEPTEADDLAAILFTSGSTGIPKGAMYTHGIFSNQIRLLRQMYEFGDDTRDLSTFPLFALFLASLGAAAIIPDMDARKPAQADPRRLIGAIEHFGCNTMFGSPALLDTLSRYGEEHGVRLPTIRRVLSAGAPVRPDILRRMHGMLEQGVQVYTPYGATESLPVANIGSAEVLDSTWTQTASGSGICVGQVLSEMRVRIIEISDDPIPSWSDDLVVPEGTIGEITVRGPVVTAAYFARPDQTALAKIDEDGVVVHRMGDLGFIDEQGRLWMCGRKSQRVQTPDGPRFTVPVEMIFNQHAGVRRTALVGIGARGSELPVVLVERAPGGHGSEGALLSELRELGSRYERSRGIEHFAIYPEPFPIDIRHNAKIQREALRAWAQRRVSPARSRVPLKTGAKAV